MGLLFIDFPQPISLILQSHKTLNSSTAETPYTALSRQIYDALDEGLGLARPGGFPGTRKFGRGG